MQYCDSNIFKNMVGLLQTYQNMPDDQEDVSLLKFGCFLAEDNYRKNLKLKKILHSVLEKPINSSPDN